MSIVDEMKEQNVTENCETERKTSVRDEANLDVLVSDSAVFITCGDGRSVTVMSDGLVLVPMGDDRSVLILADDTVLDMVGYRRVRVTAESVAIDNRVANEVPA